MPARIAASVLMAPLWVFGTAGWLSAQAATHTTLSVTAGGNTVTSVSSGTVVALTASVTQTVNSNAVTAGTVKFCDATATRCEDAHLFGTAQLTSKGTATLKFRPAPGAHSYYAAFVGTRANASSASGTEDLIVTGGPFATTTSIAPGGSAGNYTLTATVTSTAGTALAPSGTVDFIDTSNSVYTLASASLTPGTTGLSYASPVVSSATSGTQPQFSAMADFNQDGIPDIAVSDHNPSLASGNVIDIYFGNGDGTFTKQALVETNPDNRGANDPKDIVAGDLNGDGYPDLVVIVPSGLEVFLNNGSGGFSLLTYYNLSFTDFASTFAPQDPVALALGDVNNDGHLDVVFSFGHDFDPQPTQASGSDSLTASFVGVIGVALGNGDGTLQIGGNSPFVPVYGVPTDNATAIALADLTGNGNLDVITADDRNFCVQAGNGDGTFLSDSSTCNLIAPGGAGNGIVVADFNGDGKPDLAGFTIDGSDVSVILGNGDRTFQIPTDSSELPTTYNAGIDAQIKGLTTADLNGDGIPDLAMTNSYNNTVTVMLGNGDGTFQAALDIGSGNTSGQAAPTFPAGNGPYSIQAGDFSGSGVPSLAVAEYNGNSVGLLAGSITTTATATAIGISPVGPATNTDAVNASYEGDAYYSASTSGTTPLIAQPVPTSMGIQSNLSTVTVGGQVTLTATITPYTVFDFSTNGETVNFYDHGSLIGTATLSHGVATLKPNLKTVETASLTASYPGDGDFLSSSSASAQVTVQKASTTLTIQVCGGPALTCPATTSAYGNSVLVTATLTPYNVTGGSSTDGEPVSFFNNGTLLGTSNLKDGSTTFVLDEPNVGSYSFTASYGGDASFIGSSTSSASSFTVTKATSNLGFQISPGGGGPATYGQPVYLAATFQPYQGSSDTVNGETITFYDNGSPVGTAQLAGLTANLTLNNLAVGNHTFGASYPGDSNFFSSNASPGSVQVIKLTTTLGVSPSPSGTSTYGGPITIQAFLSPSSVSGGNTTDGETVSFLDNGSPIGTGTLSHGSAMFTLNVPPAGSNAFSATYAGDSSFSNSSAIPPVSVLVQPQPTTIGIVSNAPNNTIGAGQPVTFTANLNPYAVTGGGGTNGEQVTFIGDGNPIGYGTLANGIATYTTTSLTAGYHSISVRYPGDGNFAMSNASSPVSVQVLPATTLTLSTNPANFAALNQAVSLTATLSPYSANGNSTNGELIIFFNGTTNIGNAPLVNGVATFNIPNGLAEGTYSFTAVYQGDAFLAGSNTSANPLTFSVATVENFVVNYGADDFAGNAADCSPQDSTTSNSGDLHCSLRDALLAAVAAPEGANITFDNSLSNGPATLNLIHGVLTVPANTTLTGPILQVGANVLNLITINGGGAQNAETSSVFSVPGTGAAIKNLTITGGYPVWNNGNPLPGGGISNSGSLTLTNCEITGNGDIGSGGGIYNAGTLTIIGSTIDNNQGSYNGPGNGGGIDNENSGTLTIVNSTIANNTTSGGYGGGIYLGSGSLTMTNSTVSGNLGGRRNGIDNEGTGDVLLYNSIVSYNIGAGWSDVYGSYTDKGGNIIGVANGTTITNANSVKLGALGNNGGPTPTMLPLPGSNAICGGTITNSPSQWQPQSAQIDTDQRGFLNYTEAYQPYGGPALCVDAGAVQTAYTAIQFGNSSYSSTAGTAVTPAVIVAVTENGQNRGSIPITLSYSGPGFLSGDGTNPSISTVEGVGATFDNVSVDTPGSGNLTATISITPCVTTCSGVQFSASASLQIYGPVGISPGAQSFSSVTGASFSQNFSVSGGSGSYQLTSTSTLPNGLALSPSGTSSGSSWTLSGTPTQSGTFRFSLTATDATNSSNTSTQSYTIQIAAITTTTTTLVASPASTAFVGQTVTLTATVSPSTATGTVAFYDGANLLGAVNLNGSSPNTASVDLNASTLGSPLSLGTHSFTAQYSGDVTDTPSASNSVPYTVTLPNLVVNTTSDDDGSFSCAQLTSTTSNTTDGNNSGNPGLCTLRDALNSASAIGGANIYFDNSVFAASNLAGNPAANTIAVNNSGFGSSLNIGSNTLIQGLTSGNGATHSNLVTVDGGGTGLSGNGTIFIVGGTGAVINNLNINNGYASNGGNGGAITNFGSITISESTFTGNQASASGGAIFNVGGSVTVTGSTFVSNTAAGGFGGAIDNSNSSGCGTTTVTTSTFYRNTAANGGGGQGGAIFNDGNNGGGCVLTVAESTIYGNTTDNAGVSAAGIYSSDANTMNLGNSIVSGNSNGSSAEDDLYAASMNDAGGNVVGQTANQILLAPLGNYGGPTKTLLPLPGSPAICASSLIPSGANTDQRGFPNTNTLYPGFSSTACVDAGAVQTNYTLTFSQQPSNEIPGAVISPAPAVSVTESGVAISGATVTVAAEAGTLSGTNMQATIGGIATFSGLSISTAETNDSLTATLSLNPALATPLTIRTASNPFNVTAPSKATPTVSTWPSASTIPFGQTLASSSLTGGTASVPGAFAWTVPSIAPHAGVQSRSVTFTPTDTTDYNTVIGYVTITVNKAAPTVSAWPAASAIPFGQTLASSTLTGGAASLPGAFAWTVPSIGPHAGVQSRSVTFTPTDTTDYNTVIGYVTITVNNATPTVSAWPTASAIPFGQTLASSILTGGTASVPGAFAWSAPSIAPHAGVQSRSVTFTPTDSTDYNAVIGYVTITVNKATPTVSPWPAASTITFGQTLASSTLTGGAASVPGTFAWSMPSIVPHIGVQSRSVTFTPNDSTDYNTVSGYVTITVNKATPTVSTWPTASATTFGQTLASSTLTGGTASVPGTFAWSAPSIAPYAGVQSRSVTFTPTDTTDYNTVIGYVTITVNKATPTIIWAT
ncbi:MAG TPA: Ig-like domain repeat protein, partial [Terracidiphilus sp.]|nr:Ig-like domain repeat protein [Terracidiphilus sp.]